MNAEMRVIPDFYIGAIDHRLWEDAKQWVDMDHDR